MFCLKIVLMIQSSYYKELGYDPRSLREVLECDRFVTELKKYTQADTRIVEDIDFIKSIPTDNEFILFYGDPFPNIIHTSPLEWQEKVAQRTVLMDTGMHYNQDLINRFGFAAVVDDNLYTDWRTEKEGWGTISCLQGLVTVLREMLGYFPISKHRIGVYGSMAYHSPDELPAVLAHYLETYLNVVLKFDLYPDLAQILSVDQSDFVGRGVTAMKLGRLRNPQAINILQEFLDDEHSYVRSRAVYGLALHVCNFGTDHDDLCLLLRPVIFDDSNKVVRSTAVSCLTQYANQEEINIQDILYRVVTLDSSADVRQTGLVELFNHAHTQDFDPRSVYREVMAMETDESVKKSAAIYLKKWEEKIP